MPWACFLDEENALELFYDYKDNMNKLSTFAKLKKPIFDNSTKNLVLKKPIPEIPKSRKNASQKICDFNESIDS